MAPFRSEMKNSSELKIEHEKLHKTENQRRCEKSNKKRQKLFITKQKLFRKTQNQLHLYPKADSK